VGVADNKAALRRIFDEVINRRTCIWRTSCTPRSTRTTLTPESGAAPRGWKQAFAGLHQESNGRASQLSMA